MRSALLGLVGALGLVAGGCGPTVFKGPSGPPPLPERARSGAPTTIIDPVEMPFAVHTRSRNGVTRLHSQLGAGDFVSSGVMVAATTNLTKPLAQVPDARQIYAVGGTPEDLYVFAETLIGNSVRRVKAGALGPSFRGQGAEGYIAMGVDEHGAFVLVGNPAAPRPYARARVELITDAAAPSGLALDTKYCWETVGARKGEVLVAGRACGEGDSRLVVQRFTGGSKTGVFDKLPGHFPPDGQVKDVHLHAQKTGIFVTATQILKGNAQPYAAKWNGKDWSLVDVPEQFSEILSFSEGTDGALFVVETQAAARSAHVWRRHPKDGWHPVPLPQLREVEHLTFSKIAGKYVLRKPPQFVPLTVSARTVDDVWVAASIEDGDDLIHSLLNRAPTASLIDWPEVARAKELPIAECTSTYFVALGPIPPNHQTYAELRRALSGHLEVDGATLLETVVGGRHVHGVHHTSRAAAERVIELLEKAGSKPVLQCGAPAATRIIPFKLATGELGTDEPATRPEGGSDEE
ncbi:MAG: hypothetical protein IPF92_08160 [Myxococcales bacterium]|jgi:hypothetical protein|nr:hypothetical protein [Myxococcales bacterium]MBL0193288.1 hypothetical protein [Myxococcales bacterium]HQY63535.1 hypothetical protein [Polyangiaceae bacterium]